jgi:hypothetical protein
VTFQMDPLGRRIFEGTDLNMRGPGEAISSRSLPV